MPGRAVHLFLAALLLLLPVGSKADGAVTPVWNASAPPPFVAYTVYTGRWDTPGEACQYFIEKDGWSSYGYGGVESIGNDYYKCMGATGYWIFTVITIRSCDGIAWSGSTTECSRNECPANATGTPTINPTTCTCDEGYAPDPTGTSCVKSQYTLELTPENATIEPGKDKAFTVTVKDHEQTPTDSVTVNINLKVDHKSGGHDHGDSTRPRGGIDGKSCESDDTCKTLTLGGSNGGSAAITFNSRDAAGKHIVTASCGQCSNSPQSVEVQVKVEGLEPIPAFAAYSREFDHVIRPRAHPDRLSCAV